MARILIEGFQCERCSYRWAPRQGTTVEPKVCPQMQEQVLEQAPPEISPRRIPGRPARLPTGKAYSQLNER